MRRPSVFWLFLLILTACTDQWRFAAFGDAGASEATGDIPAVFGRVIERINQTDCELALFTGDLVSGRTTTFDAAATQYAHAANALKALKPRLLIVPGNHDYDGAGREEFMRGFQGVPWIAVHKGWTFIGLSTEESGAGGMIVGDQLRWLKDRLSERSTRGKTVIVMHRPVWPTPLPEGRYHSVPQPDLHRLFVESGVTAVVSGHEHHFRTDVRNGVLYVITGGTGSEQLPGSEHHFVRFDVIGKRLVPHSVRVP